MKEEPIRLDRTSIEYIVVSRIIEHCTDWDILRIPGVFRLLCNYYAEEIAEEKESQR